MGVFLVQFGNHGCFCDSVCFDRCCDSFSFISHRIRVLYELLLNASERHSKNSNGLHLKE